jgi:hypothetical protein
MEMLDRVAFAQSVEEIRSASVRNGTDSMTLKEIDAEVRAVRDVRHPTAVRGNTTVRARAHSAKSKKPGRP